MESQESDKTFSPNGTFVVWQKYISYANLSHEN